MLQKLRKVRWNSFSYSRCTKARVVGAYILYITNNWFGEQAQPDPNYPTVRDLFPVFMQIVRSLNDFRLVSNTVQNGGGVASPMVQAIENPIRIGNKDLYDAAIESPI